MSNAPLNQSSRLLTPTSGVIILGTIKQVLQAGGSKNNKNSSKLPCKEFLKHLACTEQIASNSLIQSNGKHN